MVVSQSSLQRKYCKGAGSTQEFVHWSPSIPFASASACNNPNINLSGNDSERNTPVRLGLVPQSCVHLPHDNHPTDLTRIICTELEHNPTAVGFALFLIVPDGNVDACATPNLLLSGKARELLESQRLAIERLIQVGNATSSCPIVSCGHQNLIGAEDDGPQYSPSEAHVQETLASSSAAQFGHRQPPSSCAEDANGVEDDTDVPEGRRVERIAIDPSNKEAVDDFFNKSVAVLQESAMKEILKKIIKVIEPKKQSKYPYQSSETKIKKGLDPRVRYPVPMVPPWWPKEGVIHKEPDHIQKEERRLLLNHLLRVWPLQLPDHPPPPAEGEETNSPSLSKWTWYPRVFEAVKECKLQQPKDTVARSKRRVDVLNALLEVVSSEFDVLTDQRDPDKIYVDFPEKIPPVVAKKSKKKKLKYSFVGHEISHSITGSSTDDSMYGDSGKRIDFLPGVSSATLPESRRNTPFVCSTEASPMPCNISEDIDTPPDGIPPYLVGAPAMQTQETQFTSGISFAHSPAFPWKIGTKSIEQNGMCGYAGQVNFHCYDEKLNLQGSNGLPYPIQQHPLQILNPVEGPNQEHGNPGFNNTSADVAVLPEVDHSSTIPAFFNTRSFGDPLLPQSQLPIPGEQQTIPAKRACPSTSEEQWPASKYAQLDEGSTALQLTNTATPGSFAPKFPQQPSWVPTIAPNLTQSTGPLHSETIDSRNSSNGHPDISVSNQTNMYSSDVVGGLPHSNSLPNAIGLFPFANHQLQITHSEWSVPTLFGDNGVPDPHFSSDLSSKYGELHETHTLGTISAQLSAHNTRQTQEVSQSSNSTIPHTLDKARSLQSSCD